MPSTSPFSITVNPEGPITVEAAARTASFALNVKNEGSAAERVVVDIEADGTGSPAGNPSWLSVTDNMRTLPAGGLDKFPVSVAVPAAVQPGSYSIVPIAYSADRPPEETRMRGPRTTLVVPTPPDKPVPWYRRWWPWWLVALAALLVLVVAIVVVVRVLSGGGDKGGPTPSPSPSPSPPARALRFDGNKIATIPTGSLGIGPAFSVEATVTTPATLPTGGQYGGIVRAAINGDGGAWVMFVNGSQWGLSVCTPGCNAARGTLAPGRRQHLAGTYDGTTIRVFQDGGQVASVPWAGTVSSFSTIQVGKWVTGFVGDIDDVAIWTRARSTDELRGDVVRQVPAGDPGLVGLWRFDEASGQQVMDSSPGGHPGFLGDNDQPDPADPARVDVPA